MVPLIAPTDVMDIEQFDGCGEAVNEVDKDEFDLDDHDILEDIDNDTLRPP